MISTRNALLGSLALNIFLVAFGLGRGGMHPPADVLIGPYGKVGHEAAGGTGKMPPPPFMRPDMLFSKEEMAEGFATMKESFKTLGKNRKEFADTLEARPVSKEEVLAHFAELNRETDRLRDDFQQRAAEKISALPENKREEFAKKLASGPGMGFPRGGREPRFERGPKHHPGDAAPQPEAGEPGDAPEQNAR